jgi:Domain of unknown function (DUF4185)
VPELFSGLIQSSFGTGEHGNFEAVIRVGDELWHYWRDSADPGFGWHRGKRVCAGAAYAGSIFESRFASGPSGNFEVAVPLRGPFGWPELWHFRHDNSDMGSDWQQLLRITDVADVVEGPASLIQSHFDDVTGDFQLVVPLMVSSGRPALWHFWFDMATGAWVRGTQVTAPEETVMGPASITQSNLGASGADFELVVPLLGPDAHPVLWHYRHDNSEPGSFWVKVNPVTGPGDVVAGSAGIIQSDYGDSDHGNLEVVVPLRMPDGHVEVRHFWRDAAQVAAWNRGDLITASARRGVALLRSDFHVGRHRNFEVLAEEGQVSVTHYYRHNNNDGNPWLRTVPIIDFDRPLLTGEPAVFTLAPPELSKICQLTGEYDLEGWGQLILGEASPLTPAVASHQEHLFIGWKSTSDDTLNLMVSALAPHQDWFDMAADDLGPFGGKRVVSATSKQAPALCSHAGRLFFAWTGLSDRRLSVAPVSLFGNTSGGLGVEDLDLSQRTILGETSMSSPALASHQGRLFLAWRGDDNRLNLMFSADGARFGGKRILAATSEHAPALASHNGQLFLAWTGVGNGRLNVAPVVLIGNTSGGFAIEDIEPSPPLGELSSDGPALASHAGRLFLAWKGLGNTELNIMVSDDNGHSFAGKPRVSTASDGTGPSPQREATPVAPSLTSHAGMLIWAWPGVPNDLLNVARYQAPAQPRRGPFGSAHNRTETQVGIRGTDGGGSFVHGGRLCFLFGDTWRIGQEEAPLNLDSVAFAALDQDPDQGLDLTFNRQPPLIAGGQVMQVEDDTPLEGVSVGGIMFVFFSDQSFPVLASALQIRRSVLASSADDGLNFTFLREFSRLYFTSSISLEVTEGAQLGLPDFGPTLLIWGTGRARSGDLYLAVIPLTDLAAGGSLRFFAGDTGLGPVWTEDEKQAAPLFSAGGVGEHSVRWNWFLNSWMVLYKGLNPDGIVLRLAPHPWGPWTGPVVVLASFFNQRMGRFLHLPADSRQPWHDWQWDELPVQDASRETAAGDPYNPSLISPFTRGQQGVISDFYFAMSTWNPYQVVLMKASLLAAELPPILAPERFQAVRWARQVVSLTGGGMPDEDPQAVLGPPDGAVMVIRPGTSVTFGEFGVEPAAAYPALPSLFTAARITWGDPVRLETFARADIVAFERNGFFPVSSGGFESCDWLFSGGGASVAVPWDGRIGVGRDDHIVASGNVRGADYRAMFGMDNEPPEVPIGDEEIMSYLMIAVPEVDTAAADFTITVTGRSPGAGEDVTPDIDVIGVLPRASRPGFDMASGTAMSLLADSAQAAAAGQTTEAAEDAQQAVTVLGSVDVAFDQRPSYLSLLAEVQHTLVLRLIAAGRIAEAVGPASAAAAAYTALAAVPGADRIGIAQSLLALCDQITPAQQQTAAVEAAQDAADIVSGTTPPVPPDAGYLGLLAQAQHILVLRLIAAGRIPEAVGPADHAADAYRALAAVPGADRIGIARSLLALCDQITPAQQQFAAVDAAQYAADIVAGTTPPVPPDAGYLGLLAQARQTLVLRLIAAGRALEAVALAGQAISTWKTYAAATGADIAQAVRDLTQLAAQLQAIGDAADAAAAQQAAHDLAAPG